METTGYCCEKEEMGFMGVCWLGLQFKFCDPLFLISFYVTSLCTSVLVCSLRFNARPGSFKYEFYENKKQQEYWSLR